MSNEKVLIVGSGGREFELGRRSSLAGAEVFFAPGNGGTEYIESAVNLDIQVGDTNAIVDFAEANKALVVIGPEKPLVSSLADRLRLRDVPVFGPEADAAMITEGSKIAAMAFMERHGIAHPPGIAVSNLSEADAEIKRRRAGTY